MDLGLELSPRITGGFAARPLEFDVVRELRVEDIALLDLPRTQPPALKRLSERHHAAARNLALGMKDIEVAAILGFSVNRVTILKNDPAFKELIEFYRASVDREARSNFERLAGITADAADILQERLETDPDKVSTGQLVEIIKMGADRSGTGPQTSSVQLNINVGMADKIRKAREAAARASGVPKTIEGEATEVPLPLSREDLGAT